MMKISQHGIAIALLALSGAAFGQASPTQTEDRPPRWSAGLQLRSVNWSFPDLAGGRNDHRSQGLGLVIGRDFGRHFGIEFGYDDLGQVEQRDATQYGSAELKGLFVRGVGRLALSSEVALVGRVGILLGRMETEGTLSKLEPGYCCGATITFGAPQLGLGLRWDLSRDWQLSLEATRYLPSDSRIVDGQTSIGLGIAKRF
jgi:hypothetical protein